MIYELDLLTDVECAHSKNAKERILKSGVGNRRLEELLDAAFSYKRRYYVNKFSVVAGRLVAADLHQVFLNLLTVLESRSVTGHAAIAEVEQFFGKCSEQQATWYSRVLRRDLRAGFSADTCVKVGFNVPVFDVMLAKDAGQCKRIDKIVAAGAYASRKLDGYRCVAIVDNGEVSLMSRGGEPYKNFPALQEALTAAFPNSSFVLDGEVMSDNFNSMQKSAFASKRGTVVGDMYYAIFDMVPIDEWQSENFKLDFADRLDALKRLLSTTNSNMLRLVEQVKISCVNNIAPLQAQYESEGFEGLMLKPNIPYYKGKVSNKMLKFKSVKTMEAEVVDTYEGEAGKKYEGTLGGFVVTQENGKVCHVGGGISDAERDKVWMNRDSVVGRLIEVEYQELSEHGVMRFPEFVRYRDRGQDTKKI